MISSHDDKYMIVLNFDSDMYFGVAHALKKKWETNHSNPCEIVKCREILKDSFTLSSLQLPHDGKIKIYVPVNTAPGRELCSFQYLDNNKTKKKYIMKYNELAKILSRLIGNYNNVEINLIACGAAKGNKDLDNDKDDPKESFAVKLQECLSTLQDKDIPVVARTQITFVYNSGKKFTTDKNYPYDSQNAGTGNKINKQHGAKVYITQEEGVVDAYFLSWKKKVLKELYILFNSTDVVEKKALLQKWINDFKNKQPEDILTTMRNEIDNNNSVLMINKTEILNLFGYVTKSYEKIKNLTEEGEKLILNKYPTKGLK